MSPAPKVLPITGYLDRVSARPGESLSAMISAEGPGDYGAEVVRIVCADPNPAGPGLIYAPADFGLVPRHPARRQAIDRGSYAVIPAAPAFGADRLCLSLCLQARLLRAAPATLAAALDPEGFGWRLEATATALTLIHRPREGAEARLDLPVTLDRHGWRRVWAGWDRGAGRLVIGCAAPDGSGAATAEVQARLGPLPEAPLTFAAARPGALSRDHFNGRLEDPALHAAPPPEGEAPPAPEDARDLVAWWDFSVGIDTQGILDRGPSGLCGRLVNLPTRAVRGSRWTGAAMNWREAPRHYAAIHFHEDDLHDCGWQADFALTVPEGTPSGVYGLKLTQGAAQDVIPFYVLPAKEGPKARVCFLASTFTYQAYANHARGNCDAAMRARMADWGATPFNPDDFPVYGRSTYNFHPDGAGTAFSSRLRPVLSFRPGYLTFTDAAGSGLRHFSADSHLTHWLEARGIAFDVVTDEDLDDEGPDLIAGYATVLTGSHPEYHTPGTLDALERYTATGGKLVYLGGNGFYWRIARSPLLPGALEVRRAEGGIRAWAAEPGEAHHQLDGGYGGLWRRNGRPPQRLAGVGFSAQGLFEGSHYRRLPASHAPEVAWIFEGVDEEKLGAYGLSGGGAAGFELDRADPELGTPANAVVLARSEGHGAHFVAVPEELLSHISTVTGEAPADLIRAEIVHFERPGGGAVFAVGSITFCGSLNHRGGDNGVSRMLENVVRRFAGL